MPKVPTFNQPVPRVQAIPNARLNTAAPDLGAGAAAQTARAGQELIKDSSDFFQRQADRANKTRVREANEKLMALKNDTIWNPDTGLVTRKGAAAVDAYEEYSKKFEAGMKEIKNSLGNSNQRDMFAAYENEQKNQFNVNLQKHITAETDRYEQQVVESSLEMYQNDAVKNYMEPDMVRVNVEMQSGLIEDFGKDKGLPTEQIDMMKLKALSKTHTGIIARMASTGLDRQAHNHMATYKEQLTADDFARASKIIEEGTIRGESQRQTDVITAKAENMTQAIEQARTIEDPRLRDESVRRIKDHYATNKIAENERRDALYNQAFNIVQSQGPAASRESIPPETWVSLDPRQTKALEDRITQLRRGEEPVTDFDLYYDLKMMAASPQTQGKFANENLNLLRGKLADGEFKELVNLQSGIIKGTAKEELTGIRNDRQLVNDSLVQAGIKLKSKEAVEFYRKVDEHVLLYKKRTQKNDVPQPELQSIVDNLLTVVDPGFFNDTRLFQAKEGQSIAVDPEDVPRTERLKIREALQKRNTPVTEDRIIELYNRKLQSFIPSKTNGVENAR